MQAQASILIPVPEWAHSLFALSPGLSSASRRDRFQPGHTVRLTSQTTLNSFPALSVSRVHVKKNKALCTWRAEGAWRTWPLTRPPLRQNHDSVPAPTQPADANVQQQGYKKLSLAAFKHSGLEAAQENTNPLIAGS